MAFRRHREHEQKLIQDAAAKRIEELVNKRVEEELEKRKEEIEAEVARRIEEAKKVMEKEMMEELERRKMQLLEEEKKREVGNVSHGRFCNVNFSPVMAFVLRCIFFQITITRIIYNILSENYCDLYIYLYMPTLTRTRSQLHTYVLYIL